MRRKVALFVTAFLLCLGVGMPSAGDAGGGECLPAMAQPTEAKGSVVSISNCAYGPTILRTAVGSTVTWKNVDYLPHAVAGAGWRTQADAWGHFNPGQSVTHQFGTAGIFPYMCHLHPGMTGIVIVGDAAFGGGQSTSPVAAAPATAAPTAIPTPAAARRAELASVPSIDLSTAAALIAFAAIAGYLFAVPWTRGALALRRRHRVHAR
jgi:plastocyanin